MKLRYIGSDESRDLPVSGGLIVCKRNQWVDVAKWAADSHIDERHVQLVARGLGADWEIDEGKGKKADAPKGDDK